MSRTTLLNLLHFTTGMILQKQSTVCYHERALLNFSCILTEDSLGPWLVGSVKDSNADSFFKGEDSHQGI